MQIAHNQFLANISSIKELHDLYHQLKHIQHLPNDLSDLLRAEIVYLVSALDKLIHELVRIGMIQTFKGQRVKTASFENFTISAKTLEKIKQTTIDRIQNPNAPVSFDNELPEYWFEQEIVLKHKSLSYQDPKKINEGLSLIWNETYKWQKIAEKIGDNKKEKEIKNTLETIVNRRNKIVHEADIDIVTHTKNPIDENDATEFIAFIENLGNAIFNCVK